MKGLLHMGEHGRLSRRSLLLALPSLAIARNILAQPRQPLLRAHALNQMTFSVSDVKRSVDFYQGLFGMPIQARQGDTVCLRIGSGPQFIALRPSGAGVTPSISQFGISVEDFDADRTVKALVDHGVARDTAIGPMKVQLKMREGTPEVYLGDPDGIVVQLQDPRYCGGAGVRGDVAKVEPSTKTGLLTLREMSHFTVFVSDGARTQAFFQELFGLSVRARQGPAATLLGIGPGVHFVFWAGGGPAPAARSTAPRRASINHGCMSVEPFNVEAIQKALESYGIRPRENQTGPVGPMRHYVSLRMEDRGGAKEGTPELYFTDPDGILVQLQDVRYCGGGGYLGDVCLS
jgi:catechol 2,3-dioxygenase-like lactoylglutathione lyase family enzyme